MNCYDSASGAATSVGLLTSCKSRCVVSPVLALGGRRATESICLPVASPTLTAPPPTSTSSRPSSVTLCRRLKEASNRVQRIRAKTAFFSCVVDSGVWMDGHVMSSEGWCGRSEVRERRTDPGHNGHPDPDCCSHVAVSLCVAVRAYQYQRLLVTRYTITALSQRITYESHHSPCALNPAHLTTHLSSDYPFDGCCLLTCNQCVNSPYTILLSAGAFIASVTFPSLMFAAAVKEHKARELQHKQHISQLATTPSSSHRAAAATSTVYTDPPTVVSGQASAALLC